jgi:DNA-binding IclR family transcriptional regulator
MSLPAQPNQSLIDGLAVLAALSGAAEPVGSRELARRLALEPTRVNRLLKTLAALGLAEQDPARRYRPGPAVHVLAAQSLHGSGLIRRALPHLESLHRHAMIVALGVLWRDQVCYLYHGEPGMAAAEALGRIALRPATLTGVGTMLLASRSNAEIRSLYGKSPIPNHSSPDDLLRLLERARRDECVRVVTQRSPRRATVAVPVGATRYAAIALSGPIDAADTPRIAALLRAAALAIDPDSPQPKEDRP